MRASVSALTSRFQVSPCSTNMNISRCSELLCYVPHNFASSYFLQFSLSSLPFHPLFFSSIFSLLFSRSFLSSLSFFLFFFCCFLSFFFFRLFFFSHRLPFAFGSSAQIFFEWQCFSFRLCPIERQ